MAGPTDTVVFKITCGSEHLQADLALSVDDAWTERTQTLRDSVGPTSAFVWMASRRKISSPLIWEVEWDICAGACDPDQPDAKATILCVDGVEIELPRSAPHVEHQNPRSQGVELASACVIPARYGICGRFAIGPEDHAPMLQQISYGMPDGHEIRVSLSRYGPANWPQPMYDQAKQSAKWEGKFSALRAAMAAGVEFSGEDWGDGIRAEALACGWKLPYLEFNRSAYGGSGIELLSGWQGIWHARYALLSHMLVAQRVRYAYNAQKGLQPLSVDDYPNDSPLYDWAGNELPCFQNVRVIGTPQEPIYTASFSFLDPDPEHDIRGQRKAIEGYEYFQSPLCARHICARAEDRRLMFSEKGPTPTGGYAPYNLRNLASAASVKPHAGGPVGRAWGWTMHSAAMLFKIRGTHISRGWKGWAQKSLTMLSTMEMPTGICQRSYDTPHANPADVDCCQAFECPILAWGAYALSTQSKYPIGDWALESAEQLYRTIEQVEDTWNAGWHGPPHYVFVAAHDGAPFLALTAGQGADGSLVKYGDTTHKEPLCALAFRLSKDLTWFDTAAHTRDWDGTRDAYLSACMALLAAANDDPTAMYVPMVLSEWQRVNREGRV